MKKFRIYCSLVMAICCCAAFTGCGDSSGNDSSDSSSSEIVDNERESDDTDKESDEDGETEKSDKNEESDKSSEKEKTDKKPSKSNFTPQFADEDELSISQKLWDDDTDAGNIINWSNAPCIGKGITIDGIEITGGELLDDYSFDNWSMDRDYSDKVLQSDTLNELYYDHSSDAGNEHELMYVNIVNTSSIDKNYGECMVAKMSIGGPWAEMRRGEYGSDNALDYYDMTDAVESSVKLPYGVEWDMTPSDVEEILGTPFKNDTINVDDSRGDLWRMNYYTTDKYHTITFVFNLEQSCKLCSVVVEYDYRHDN